MAMDQEFSQGRSNDNMSCIECADERLEEVADREVEQISKRILSKHIKAFEELGR